MFYCCKLSLSQMGFKSACKNFYHVKLSTILLSFLIVLTTNLLIRRDLKLKGPLQLRVSMYLIIHLKFETCQTICFILLFFWTKNKLIAPALLCQTKIVYTTWHVTLGTQSSLYRNIWAYPKYVSEKKYILILPVSICCSGILNSRED